MEIEKTVTSIFMIPTLKIPEESLFGNGFINGYSKDAHREVQYEDVVYILFQPKDLDKFRYFLDSEYERTKAIIDDYDYPDGLVVVVYKLDPAFKPDFDLIRQGKYSKTSSAFKNLFGFKKVITEHGLKKEVWSLQYRVFFKTQDMIDYWEEQFGVPFDKNMEVWHGFFDSNETLNLDKIKQHV